MLHETVTVSFLWLKILGFCQGYGYILRHLNESQYLVALHRVVNENRTNKVVNENRTGKESADATAPLGTF